MRLRVIIATVCALFASNVPLRAQRPDTVFAAHDSVVIRLVDVDVRAAVQALAPFLDRPIVLGAVSGAKVTLETSGPIPRANVVPILRTMLISQNLELVDDSVSYRVRPLDATQPQNPSRADQGQGTGAVELFVVRLRHARAPEVAATVNALFGRASALGEQAAKASTLSDQLRQNRIPPQGALPPQAVASVAGREAMLTGDVTIVPDARANSMLIRASRSDFELIEAAIREIDVRPLQVLIEVLIVEVRKDRSISFGVDAALPAQRLPGSGTQISGSTAGASLGDFVLKLMGVGGIDLDATLRAAASRGDVSIVSRPIVITANNELAEILVGSQRPFVQVSRSLPTDSPLRDQVIQYKDVGTRLVILPTISDDGYVMLDVTQEVNAATTETAFDAPIISTRTVQTRLLVKDGRTVALGGLSDRQRDTNQGGTPLLSSIPIVGGLFGRSSKRSSETELFLFVTPRVIRSDDDAEQLTAPMRKKAERVKP